MKFRIEQQRKVESIVKLRLEYDGDDVNVVSVMENEDEYHLISFNSDGTFFKYSSIGENTGFKLNKSGKIVERK